MFKKLTKDFKDMFKSSATNANKSKEKSDDSTHTEDTFDKDDFGELKVTFNEKVDKSTASFNTKKFGFEEGVSVMALISSEKNDGFALMCAGDTHKIANMVVNAVADGAGPFALVKALSGRGNMDSILKGATSIKGGDLSGLLETLKDLEPKDEMDEKANTVYNGKKTVH